MISELSSLSPSEVSQKGFLIGKTVYHKPNGQRFYGAAYTKCGTVETHLIVTVELRPCKVCFKEFEFEEESNPNAITLSEVFGQGYGVSKTGQGKTYHRLDSGSCSNSNSYYNATKMNQFHSRPWRSRPQLSDLYRPCKICFKEAPIMETKTVYIVQGIEGKKFSTFDRALAVKISTIFGSDIEELEVDG